jgi:hypothetical protein
MQLNLCTEGEWAVCYGDIDFCLGFVVGGVFLSGNCLPVLDNTRHSRSGSEACQQRVEVMKKYGTINITFTHVRSTSVCGSGINSEWSASC